MALRVGVGLGGTPISVPILGWVASDYGPRSALGRSGRGLWRPHRGADYRGPPAPTQIGLIFDVSMCLSAALNSYCEACGDSVRLPPRKTGGERRHRATPISQLQVLPPKRSRLAPAADTRVGYIRSSA